MEAGRRAWVAVALAALLPVAATTMTNATVAEVAGAPDGQRTEWIHPAVLRTAF